VVDNPASKGTGNETDLEQISVWDPEVIFFSSNSVYATVADDPAWSNLTAIKDGRYYEVPAYPYNWFGSPPSVQRYLFLLLAGQLLYTEYVSYDIKAKIKEYYSLFYGHELTDAEFDGLTANCL